MLICMKPTSKQIDALHGRISRAFAKDGRSLADLGRQAGVHPSQVGRIVAGEFKTYSANVVQICTVLGVKVPRLSPDATMEVEWDRAHASMRRIWNETPEGAVVIRRMLDAIADLQAVGPAGRSRPSTREEGLG